MSEGGTSDLKRGRYTLLRQLGEGSQGETFEARDNGVAPPPRANEPLAKTWERYVARARGSSETTTDTSGRLVAIKRFRVAKAKAWKDVELAEREARTLASLRHPALPSYVEHFEEDGALYLVMEKVDGESLAAIRTRHGRLAGNEVIRMLRDLGDALQYLHGRAPAIVHRDIKPGNVIRRTDGSFALVDFGSVRDRLKPAGGSTVVGTFGYMAPEQFQGRAAPRSDVYGLGATAIAMLTGCEPEELPHEGLGIDVERALPGGTPEPLRRALAAMLQPDPDRRAASVDEALALLAERRSAAPAKPTRKERRALRRVAREERRRRRALARSRRAPFVPRVLAKVGLLVAFVVVWLTVGVLVPALLGVLSLVFGRALRRAAAACVRAAHRAQGALGRASRWLSGERRDDEEPARLRIAAEPDVARMLVEPDEVLEDMAESEDLRRLRR